MTKALEKSAQPLNHNLQNLKPFRGGSGKLPAAKAPSSETAPQITEQAKNLNEAQPVEQSAEAAPKQETQSKTEKAVDKASTIAKAISKVPVLPILSPSPAPLAAPKPVPMEKKVVDKKMDPPQHFIKKPAVIFIEGFSAFGISNGDGIKEMADNYPGAKRFDWTDHDKIVEEIKKHDPKEPVVLVGHSFGGDTAIEVANDLNSAKHAFRTVDLLVSIDAVGMNKTIIPVNVKSNLNFFGEGLIPFVHGDPTVARNTKYTEVTNELRTDMHSKMDDSPEVQFEIFNKINEVLGKNDEPEEVIIEIGDDQIKNVLESILKGMKAPEPTES